ncbi:hypothetical protein IE81DRAFT_332696 [Ceraceosorus guamensis]|uniref:Uncharacterized protein n=1 Tax=Ceraceosorus guamensis TaxID=1522189 RepID=A0A316VPD4_9BASI|nr:hypothetical protein IE81DRAFT_332696 [Ceraceosorus guamensis]PWN38928.1 hypothetical protein IE81DRAFT_332696 [Ceraceosorus guamensis]
MVSAFNLAFILCAVSVAHARTLVKPEGFTKNAILVKWTVAQDTNCRANIAAADQCWLKACTARSAQSFTVNLLGPVIEEGLNSGNAWAECTASNDPPFSNLSEGPNGNLVNLSQDVAEKDVSFTVIG